MSDWIPVVGAFLICALLVVLVIALMGAPDSGYDGDDS